MANGERQIVCGQPVPCGFRVSHNYFATKRRFYPGICPRCGGTTAVVEHNSNTVVVSAHVGADGAIVFPSREGA